MDKYLIVAIVSTFFLMFIDTKFALQSLSAGSLALATASIAYMTSTTTQKRNADFDEKKRAEERDALIQSHAIWLKLTATGINAHLSAVIENEKRSKKILN